MVEAALIGIALSVIGNIGRSDRIGHQARRRHQGLGSLIPGHGGIWDVFDSLV